MTKYYLVAFWQKKYIFLNEGGHYAFVGLQEDQKYEN